MKYTVLIAMPNKYTQQVEFLCTDSVEVSKSFYRFNLVTSETVYLNKTFVIQITEEKL